MSDINYELHDESMLVFTHKSKDFLLSINGSTSWKLDPARARKCKYIVCVKNARHPQVLIGEPPHSAAFMIGRVSDIVESSTNSIRDENRYTVKFDSYADIYPENGVWNKTWSDICNGQRWPVKYIGTDDLVENYFFADLDIVIDDLEFRDVPEENWSFAEEYLAEENKYLGIVANSKQDTSLDDLDSNKAALDKTTPIISKNGITIKEAKKRLSQQYDIPEDSIEIILKG